MKHKKPLIYYELSFALIRKSFLLFIPLFLSSLVDSVTLKADVGLTVHVFLQGYYIGSGLMAPVRCNEYACSNTGSCPYSNSDVDSITVEMVNSSNQMVDGTYTGFLATNGVLVCNFAGLQTGNYYITVAHQNSVKIWSTSPLSVIADSTYEYDFTSSASQVYGNNVTNHYFDRDGVPVFNDTYWMMFSGDCSQDGNVDLLDFPLIDTDINSGGGGLVNTDLNGDGGTDLIDMNVFFENNNLGIYTISP